MAVDTTTSAPAGTLPASCPITGSIPAARSSSQYADSERSDPVTDAPSACATRARPLIPAPPIPTKWSSRPAHSATVMARDVTAPASDRKPGAAGAAGRATGRSLPQAKQGAGDMAYEVPDLPYDYGALEPHIDEQTMRLHHDKHHQAYVDKANAALDGTEWADKPVEEVLKNLGSLPDDIRTAVRNNAGGHVNHTFFWQIMSPDGGGAPDGDVAAAIEQAFGGFDAFKD